MKSNRIDMTAGNECACIIKFAIPLLGGNMLQQLYVFFDTLIVGNYVGVDGLAALGVTEWLIFILIHGAQGITHGFSIDMAQCIGRKDRKALNQSISQAVILSALLSILTAGIGLIWGGKIISLLHTPKEAAILADQYVDILYGGVIISVFYNLAAALLRAVGDGVSPLKALMLASAVNIGLDLLLVGVMSCGVRGAAIATVFAQAVSFLYCLKKLMKENILSISKEMLLFNPSKCRQLLKLGLPLGLQNIVIGIGGVIVQSKINAYGTVFIAAHTAANKLYLLLESAAGALGNAMTTFTAQNISARFMNRVKKGLRISIILSIIVGYTMSLIMILGGKGILSCFITEEEAMRENVITIGYQFLIVLAIFFPLLYILYALYACVQSMGYTIFSMISSSAQLIMRVFCAIVLTRIIGYYGFFIGEVLAWIGCDAVLLAAVLYGFRTSKGNFDCS